MANEMNALRIAKKELRKSIRQSISALPEESVSAQSRAVAALILASPEYQKAQRLSIYLSMPKREISTDPIVRNALAAGKQVFVPYIHRLAQPSPEAPSSAMDMVLLHSLEDYETLKPDSWGIPTPSKASIRDRMCYLKVAEGEDGMSEQATEENLEMVIMPGVAFDRGLGRVGHGKGYYDFFLTQYQKKGSHGRNGNRMPFLIGLALKEQMLPQDQKVPLGATDWPLDAVVVGDGTSVRR